MKQSILIVFVLAFIIGLIPSIANAKLVACVGASITEGHSLSVEDAYPAQLQLELRKYDRKWDTLNFGLSATLVIRNAPLAAYIETSTCQLALESEPNIVVIQLGGNDTLPGAWAHKENFLSDFIALIDVFAELPSEPVIYIWIPTPIFSSSYGHSNTVLREEIIPLIQQLPTHRDVHLIDLYTPFEDKAYLFPDGIHPNEEGAKLIAQIIAANIIGMRFPPDFNGDWLIDIEDLVVLIESWDQNEPSIDIVPPPLGDGVVDRQDLEAMMEYWNHELNDPALITHWPLDETEGIVACDITGNYHDANVIGDPNWQPYGGMIDGALEFDGINDYVSTPFVLDPGIGQFSVFAWIKGGMPGQTIISQADGANWLSANISDGALMTELKGGGRNGSILVSQTVITDDDWHRIGLTWDGVNRILYVDGIIVAIDTQANLEGSEGGLYIGAKNALDVDTLFHGLIDDVRIYNRAITP